MPLGVMLRNPARMEERARQVAATIVVRVLEPLVAEIAPTATVFRPVVGMASVLVRTDGGAMAATKAMGAMTCPAKMAENALHQGTNGMHVSPEEYG